MESAVLTLRSANQSKEKLDKLAAEAINRYLEIEAWQIGEIEQALAEANKGDFASDAQLTVLAAKYAG